MKNSKQISSVSSYRVNSVKMWSAETGNRPNVKQRLEQEQVGSFLWKSGRDGKSRSDAGLTLLIAQSQLKAAVDKDENMQTRTHRAVPCEQVFTEASRDLHYGHTTRTPLNRTHIRRFDVCVFLLATRPLGVLSFCLCTFTGHSCCLFLHVSAALQRSAMVFNWLMKYETTKQKLFN